MKLSILIATVKEREVLFNSLLTELNKQIRRENAKEEVEIVVISDNKEISIGLKRQKLLEMASGTWIVFFDDDDYPFEYYVRAILDAIDSPIQNDCIGINVFMTTDGARPQKCCHRLKYANWENDVDGWDYVRNITHFNPVLRTKALEVGFKDLRFGEDKDYSDRLFPLLTREIYIEAPLFYYRYSTAIKHNQKYGIK